LLSIGYESELASEMEILGSVAGMVEGLIRLLHAIQGAILTNAVESGGARSISEALQSLDEALISLLNLIGNTEGTPPFERESQLIIDIRNLIAKSQDAPLLLEIIRQFLKLREGSNPSRTREQSDFCSSITAVQRLSPLRLMSRRKDIRLISLPVA